MSARSPSKPARAPDARTTARVDGARPYHHGNLAAALAESAESLLREQGVVGFSLRECARRAGVAHSAPGHHFGDVRGLLTEVAARGFDRLTASMQAARGSSLGAEALKGCGRGYIGFALADPAVFDLLFQQPGRLDHGNPRLSTAAGAAYGELVRSVEMARGGQSQRPDDLRFAWSTVHGYANLVLSGSLDQGAHCATGPGLPASAEGLLERVVAAVTG